MWVKRIATLTNLAYPLMGTIEPTDMTDWADHETFNILVTQ